MLMLTPQALAIIRSDQAKREERERIRRNRRVARRMNDDRMERLTETTARILRTGVSSLFEFEAACRSGLRQSLIKERWTWADADECAAEIVGKALDRIGAVRPTWEEGQPDSAVAEERHWCMRCGTPIPEERKTRRRPKYCSTLCQNAANFQIGRRFRERVSWAEHVASLAQKRASRVEELTRPCAHCERPFLSRGPLNEFCSNACRSRGSRTVPDTPCRQCGTAFPAKMGKGGVRQMFCSPVCAAAGKTKRQPAPRPELSCAGCGAIFRPKKLGRQARFCSSACGRKYGRTIPRCEPIIEGAR